MMRRIFPQRKNRSLFQGANETKPAAGAQVHSPQAGWLRPGLQYPCKAEGDF
jgi:hypothetical protein